MSDYLWDKKGEADPDVERLEHLLGGLRHRPRALTLPHAEASAPRHSVFTRKRFRLFRHVAFAAALALAVVAGGLVAVLRTSDSGAGVAASKVDEGRATVAAGSEARVSMKVDEVSPTPLRTKVDAAGVATGQAASPGADSLKRKVGAHPDESESGATRAGASSAVVRNRNESRRRGRTTRASHAVDSAPRGGVEFEERAVLDGRQLEAKEQLVYALRLTSAKLEEVRRITSGDEED